MPKPSTVTFLLTPTRDNGTLLRLEHTGLEGDSGKAMLPLFRGGWEQKLTVDLDRAIDRLGAQGVRHA
jgi:hypothetical protein